MSHQVPGTHYRCHLLAVHLLVLAYVHEVSTSYVYYSDRYGKYDNMALGRQASALPLQPLYLCKRPSWALRSEVDIVCFFMFWLTLPRCARRAFTTFASGQDVLSDEVHTLCFDVLLTSWTLSRCARRWSRTRAARWNGSTRWRTLREGCSPAEWPTAGTLGWR